MNGLRSMNRYMRSSAMAKKKIRKHGEGTLFQRRDGRWQASFVPKSGGKRRYVYGKTKGEALDKLRLAQEED